VAALQEDFVLPTFESPASDRHRCSRSAAMHPLDLVNLAGLMEHTSGSPEVKIGLIDGPVRVDHPDLASESLQELPGPGATCTRANSAACLHGTFIAGMLSARRTAAAPAICPNCTLLIRPIFTGPSSGPDHMPGASPQQLAGAILDCVQAGAHVINLSLGLARLSGTGDHALTEALDHALKHGVIVVAAAGNQGTVGSSAITRHPWVVPVAACDHHGAPTSESTLGSSIGSHGLRAPGEAITSLGSDSGSVTLGGTSVAVPFVTGAAALLWSACPSATAAQVKLALTRPSRPRRASVVPPLLDAAAAYHSLLAGM
jgi:subtilisin family serine protease